MRGVPTSLPIQTLATATAGRGQRVFGALVCTVFAGVTLFLLPTASQAMAPMPGFVPSYQTALIVVYAITTYLLFAQYRRACSVPLLLLAAGSLFTTVIVLAQFLSFPNLFGPGRLIGSSADTTTWLWTFWHLGPPLFALAYAVLEGSSRIRPPAPEAIERVGWWTAGGSALAALVAAGVAAQFVHLLPKNVEGDDYRLLTTSGVGPAVVGLTILSLALLAWRTKLRTVLQLWLAVSLFLLLLDNWITLAGAARATVGWFTGRLEALVAGVILLAVYLREVDYLYGRAERTVIQRERERAELQVARDNLAIALDAAGMGNWELDLVTGRSRRSLRHDQIFGYRTLLPHWDKAEFLEHVGPDDRQTVEAAFARAAEEGCLEFHCRIRRADDGAQRWIAVQGKSYFDPDGRPTTMAGIVMDTTERREVEERLAQAQKMEAIGQLTGGVAHDFNNLLTVIVGNLDMIVRQPENAKRVQRLASSGLLAARRGAEVTEKLLAFSRRQVVRPETVNPNRLLKDFEPLLRRAVGEAVEIGLDLDAALHPVRLDPGQFESAMLNLAVNARDAMPNGGRLTLKTCNAALTSADLTAMPELVAGEYILVFVSDTGVGMDERTMARVFEPFFTTKDVGKGTGLGLSQVYGFVKQAGGHVRIESAPGAGTTVKLYLPRSAERAAEIRTDHVLPLRRADSGEVILVVEDEPAVLEMAVESLAELGYRTLTATNAAAALDRLRGGDRVDILFSDVVMPGGMNGVQLSVEARRLRPGLRVLLTSGYIGGVSEGELPIDVPLLSKPYQRNDLADKLRVVLSA